VVSKLKRFHAYDLQDIEAMVEREFVDRGLNSPRARGIRRYSGRFGPRQNGDMMEYSFP